MAIQIYADTVTLFFLCDTSIKVKRKKTHNRFIHCYTNFMSCLIMFQIRFQFQKKNEKKEVSVLLIGAA